MKKVLLLMMFPIFALGQYTSIPDSIFEQRLINFGYDSIHDGQVLTANIVNIDSLDVSSQLWGASGSISDLTGIEGFTNLIYLDCSVNPLTSLDVSQNIHLNYLDCSGIYFFSPTGQLINLNVSQNSSLSYLNCSKNRIENLDLSQTNSLSYLDCSDNRITSLDFQTPLLDTLECYNNSLSYLDISTCIALKKLNCSTNPYPWGYTPENNLTNLDLSQNINLEHLNCSGNNLSYLDVSNNIALKHLNCTENELHLLNADQNINLTYLNCSNNHISFLDVSQDTSLTTLICGEEFGGFFGPGISSGNNLKSLDLSQNFNLTNLRCSNNQLVNLNLKNGNNSNFTSFQCKNNYDLLCISVDDTSWADTNWTNLQSGNSISFNDNCPFVDVFTLVPDSMFEQKLILLGYDSLHDGQVLTSNIRNVDSLDISSAMVADLTGIEDFLNLSFLNCNMNELVNFDISQNPLLENLQCRCSGLDNLDVSQNTKLSNLDCNNDVHSGTAPCQNSNFNNSISSLNLSNNSMLTHLGVVGNALKTLDIRQNTKLENLKCQNNNLKVLDLRNGNNTNFTYFNALDNDSLFCIASDDSSWSLLNWFNIPNHSFFSNHCTDYYTLIPDLVFEKHLIHQGFDNIIDGQVINLNIKYIDSLDVSFDNYPSANNTSFNKIFNLNGIEDFINLSYLNCSENLIDSIDLSQNINLKYFDCGNNDLVNIDLSQNTDLEYLKCNGNELTNINLDQNTDLEYLNCSGNWNNLDSIDLSQNINLIDLDCGYNNISILNLTQNQNLSHFICRNNQITNIDLSQNVSLSRLNCRNNLLTNLDVSQNPALSYLIASYNQLDTLNFSQSSIIDTIDCSNNQFSHLDLSQNSNLKNLNCEDNLLSNLDLSQNINLKDFNCRNNLLTNLDVSQNPNLLDFNCRNNLLTNLDVSQNPNLLDFNCSYNQLDSLDLSQNLNLTELQCRNNMLNTLDVSQNITLNHLGCRNNMLTSLDVSHNPNLITLDCRFNLLSTLDVRNGNNLNFTYFNANPNDSLYCISVDDSTWASNNWNQNWGGASFTIPSQTIFSNDCAILSSLNLFEGTWKLAQIPGALSVGPTQGDGSWWSSSANDIFSRDCIFDDSISFDTNGNFMHYMDGSTWLETWQGVASEQCGIPVAPHDGSGPYTYTQSFNQLTVNGYGAHIGLSKVVNGREIDNGAPIPNSINYEIMFSGNGDIMTADIDIGLGWWRFIYQKTSSSGNTPATYNVTFKVHTDLIAGNISADGIYIGGGFVGSNDALLLDDSDGDGVWEGTFNLPASGGHFTILNGNCPNWSCKEDIFGQPCADPNFFNDRNHLVGGFSQDTTLILQFGSCITPSEINSQENHFSIFPNPTSEEINISAENITGKIQNEIYDLIGNRLQITNETNISLRDYTKGIYILKVSYGESVQKFKIIKD